MTDKKTLEELKAKVAEAEAELDAANARADRLVSLGRFAAEACDSAAEAWDALDDAYRAYFKAKEESND